MINKTILIGRITKDLDLRKTTSGASVLKFNLAVERNFKQDNQPTADFINCVAWNKSAELMNQYLHKGSLIGVDGRIQTGSYDDKNGNRVYTTDVVVDSIQFLDSKESHQSNESNNSNKYSNNIETSHTDVILSDDLPF